MSQIKLAAFDLDETLLNTEHRLSEAAASLLQRLMAAGVVTALATGRHFRTASQYSRQLGLNGPVICYNGAVVRRLDAPQADFVSYLDQDAIREVAALCRQRGLYLQLYDEQDRILVERITDETRADPDFYTTDTVEVGDFRQVTEFHSPKMMIFDTPARIAALNEELSQRYRGRLYLARSQAHLLEMLCPGVNKGQALSRLAASLGFGPEQVLACGDNANDAEMLRWAGCGCAVSNASAEAKAAADYLCQLPREQGVAEALERFVFAK